MQKRQILTQVKVREAIDDVAEQQKHEEGQNNHGDKLHGQNVSEILHAVEIQQDAVENHEDARPEQKTESAEHDKARPDIFPVAAGQTVERRPHARSDQG